MGSRVTSTSFERLPVRTPSFLPASGTSSAWASIAAMTTSATSAVVDMRARSM